MGSSLVVGCEDEPFESPGTGGPSEFDPAAVERLALPAGKVDVIVDADVGNEIDDQFALVYALLSTEAMRVLAVHACPFSRSAELYDTGYMTSELGYRDFDATLEALGATSAIIPRLDPKDGVATAARESERIVELMDKAVPVYRGSARFIEDTAQPVKSDAVDHLIATARGATSPLYVLAMGAATNVASAVLSAPDIRERLVVVWTSAYPTFWPRKNGSYNLAQDVLAARTLFESGVALVYLPGYFVGEKLATSLADIETYAPPNSNPVAEYLHGLFKNRPFAGDHVGKSKVLWDLINVAYVVNPNWFASDIVKAPTLDDNARWVAQSAHQPIREATDVSRDKVMADLFAKLRAI